MSCCPNPLKSLPLSRWRSKTATFGLLWIAVVLVAAGPAWASDQELEKALNTALSTTGNPSAAVSAPANPPAKAGVLPAQVAKTGNDELTNGMELLDNKYRLAIGDHVKFQVIEDQDDSKEIVVTDSGDLEVPYLGHFPAEGKTCRELAVQLKRALEKKYYYQATVIISADSKLTRGIIYLVGAVHSPGPLEMPRDDTLTISKAILRAGGFSDFADDKSVRITRKGASGTNEVFTVDVAKLLKLKGKPEDDIPIEPGDMIYIPEKTFRF